MFDGYLELGGVELINAERTQRYVHNLAPWLVLPTLEKYEDLHLALEEEVYESPLIDGAEWVVSPEHTFASVAQYTLPGDNATHRFYGLYPLDITGIGDGTGVAAVTEGILNGGRIGISREGTRAIRVHGLLVGADELAAEAGLSWLRAALTNDDCTMHDSACGQSDLRYFLSYPDVCPRYIKGFAGALDTYGGVDPSNSPLAVTLNGHGEGQNQSLIWAVAFRFPRADGQIVEWGVLDDDGKRIEHHGPVMIQRSNYAPNPSFTSDAAGWTAATSTISRVATGGVDGGAYGHLAENSPPVVRYNWAPDPAFVNSPMSASGWRMIGATTGTTATGGPTARLAIITKVTPDAALAAEVSLFGPHTPVNSTVSLWIAAHASPVIATIVDNLGTVVHTETIAAAGSGRTSFQSVIGPNYVLRLSSVQAQIQIADLLVEAGASAGTFFTGDTPDSGTNDYSWVGAPLLSASRFRAGALTSHSLATNTPDTQYSVLTESVWLRSAAGAQLTLSIVALSDGTVLSTRNVSVPFDWTRYALSAPHGRNTKLVISGTGSYDLDQVLIESGTNTADEYFDGSSTAAAGYSIGWLGAPNNSTSRQLWVNVGDEPYADDPDYDPARDGLLAIDTEATTLRPYLAVTKGAIASVVLASGSAAPIPVSDQIAPMERRYHGVGKISGPNVIKRYELSQGGYAIEVDFILTAENPFTYGSTVLVSDGWADLENFPYSDPRPVVTNLVSNPSGETATLGYTAIPGTTGVAAITNPTATTSWGTKVIHCQWSTASTVAGGGIQYGDIPVVAGQVYSFRSRLMRSSIAQNLTFQVEWRTVSATISTISATPVAAAAAAIVTAKLEALIAPAGAVVARIKVIGSAVQPIGSFLELDALMAANQSTAPFYFDGSTAGGVGEAGQTYTYAWVGTANASQSTRTMVTPAIATLTDPSLPAIPTPPDVPDVSDIAFPDQKDWRRFLVPIPAQDVPLWPSVVPTITLTSKTNALRQIRVRFMPNPFDRLADKVDPLYYCGESIVSYMPPATELVIDGISEHGFATISGQETIAADSILYGTGGFPMSWPEMSCNQDYVMAVDVLPGFSIADLAIELEVTLRE